MRTLIYEFHKPKHFAGGDEMVLEYRWFDYGGTSMWHVIDGDEFLTHVADTGQPVAWREIA